MVNTNVHFSTHIMLQQYNWLHASAVELSTAMATANGLYGTHAGHTQQVQFMLDDYDQWSEFDDQMPSSSS